jgi:hypothetical protein
MKLRNVISENLYLRITGTIREIVRLLIYHPFSFLTAAWRPDTDFHIFEIDRFALDNSRYYVEINLGLDEGEAKLVLDADLMQEIIRVKLFIKVPKREAIRAINVVVSKLELLRDIAHAVVKHIDSLREVLLKAYELHNVIVSTSFLSMLSMNRDRDLVEHP